MLQAHNLIEKIQHSPFKYEYTGEVLRRQGKALVRRLIQIIQHHISELYDDLYNKLMTELILAIEANVGKYKSEYNKGLIYTYKEQIYTMMAETLFTSRLTFLRLTYPFAMDICLPPLCSLSHQLTRLTRLDLKLSLLPHRIKSNGSTLETDIIAILTPLRALKSLSLTSYCTDEILKCIVENCTVIENLDISQSGARVDDASVRLLVQLRYLRSICLSGTSVGPRGIEELLFSCPNLVHLDIIAMLAHLLGCSNESKQKYAGRVFKLNTLDTGASLEQLMLLVQICPHIKYMSLRKCRRGNQSNNRALQEFKNINHLKLDGYEFYDDAVTDTLRDIGLKLQTLHLNGVTQFDLDALIHIIQTCPYLQNLSIDCCTFIEQRSVYKPLDIQLFRKLKKFSMGWLNVIPEPSAIMFVLCNCCNIEFIHLTSSILSILTEELMLQVLDNNPLKYLRELSLWHVDVENVVTKVVLDRIIHNSISQPVVTRTQVSPI